MSIGRNHPSEEKDLRDVENAYLKALFAEHETYRRAGSESRARDVAAELRKLGHEVEGKKAVPAKETAVSPEPLERAVEEDAPKRRGRPARAKGAE